MSTTEQEDVEGGGDYKITQDFTTVDEGETTFLCFGVCDMRIATIFANVMNIAIVLFGVLAMGVVDKMFWKAMGSAFAAGLPSLILSLICLYGANKFELWAMYLACGGFIAMLVADAILWQWVGFAIIAIVLFPTAVLTLEMKAGVLTEENYAEQQYVSPQGMELVNKAHAYIAPSVTTTTA